MVLAGLLVAGYAMIALLPLVLVIISGQLSVGNVVFEFGRCIALAAFPMILAQPILTARIAWIDRLVGRSMLLRFHKAMGVAALIGLFLHPICLGLGGAGLDLLASLAMPWFIIAGKATLVAVLFHVGIALLRGNLGITYLTWRRLHGLTAPLIFTGAFVHSWFTGSDLSLRALQVYWVALLSAAAATMTYRRFRSA